MRGLLSIFVILITVSCADKNNISQVVEVSCGQCNFDMKTPKSCDLAVRINNVAYYVDGFSIDDFGNAHDDKTGFCEVIRKGKVVGKIVNDRFEMKSLVFMEQDWVETR